MDLTGRRLVGVLLLAGSYLPLHRLLDPNLTGPAGAATRATAEAAWSVGAFGTAIAVGLAVVLVLLVPSETPARWVRRAGDVLVRPNGSWFALVVGASATVLSLGIALFLYHGLPTSVDEMAQLLHARALAAGRLAVPLPGGPTAWTIQNGIPTPEGWASIYPPFHTILLAAGLEVGAPWLVGPLAVGVATWASALSFETLLGARLGRTAGIVLALSPFWLLLGATYLSHTTAAACLALVLWTGLRARTGRLGWAVAAGMAMGGAVTARPWVGLVCAATLLGIVWWNERRRLGARVAALVAGGTPFALLFFWWNARVFGSPLRLGYSAAFGPSHGLGFHVDPWGNTYGVREALGYTGADLVQLGAHLLETPFPAVALVAVSLLVGVRRSGDRPFLGWAVAAVLTNALYWHHGINMGPRMLYESVPAWIALAVAAAADLTSAAAAPPRLRRLAGWAVAASVVGAPLLVASSLRSASVPAEGSPATIGLPDPGATGTALVFVHGSWASRVVARLAGTGMRRDSVETAIRRNDICLVDRYSRWRAADPQARTASPPAVDFRPLPGTPANLRRQRITPGDDVWIDPDATWDHRCTLERASDASGTLDLEPLLWRAPPLVGQGLVMARDMGPVLNESVRAVMGDRSAFVYVPGNGRIPAATVDYAEGMQRLWGDAFDAPAIQR